MDTNNIAVPSGNSKKTVIIALIVIIFFLTGVLAYVLLAQKAEAPVTNSQSAVPVPAKKGPAESDASAASQVKPIDSTMEAAIEEKKKEDEKYAGWMTYISKKYKYEIKFPSGTTVHETMKNDIGMPGDSKMTFDEAYDMVTSQVCVELSTKKGTIYISAPVNKGFLYALCGRTGVGNDTKITKSTEKITIAGKEYVIDVEHFSSSSGSSIESGIVLDDDTQFYVSSGNEENWAEMRKMLESYKKTK